MCYQFHMKGSDLWVGTAASVLLLLAVSDALDGKGRQGHSIRNDEIYTSKCQKTYYRRRSWDDYSELGK